MQPLIKSESKRVDSPKTPGGISKALLTPIRRLGLSRNWRKNGPSPFRSPLSGTSPVPNESSPSTKAVRKRKDTASVNCEEETEALEEIDGDDKNRAENVEPLVATPVRSVSLPRKKKSKIDKSLNKTSTDLDITSTASSVTKENVTLINEDLIEKYVDVATPTRSKSYSRRNKRINRKNEVRELDSPIKEIQNVNAEIHNETNNVSSIKDNTSSGESIPQSAPKTVIERSPNDLTKECVVVLQKKMFKNELRAIENDKNTQVLFDSDSDDVPLSTLNRDATTKFGTVVLSDDDDDFVEPKLKVKKLEDKNTSTSGLKPSKKENKKLNNNKLIQKPNKVDTNVQTSQSSLSFDDDDFDFDNKRTIVCRRSYDKVLKPSKAKSTGSITQKDIDELTARIDMKKKLLMAKAVNKDTEELRTLIKKWQRGCQDALMELMDLMRMKFPDKHNMDYSEILETLKIPANLVGYDSDNDCFVTPTDENVMLPKLNNL